MGRRVGRHGRRIGKTDNQIGGMACRLAAASDGGQAAQSVRACVSGFQREIPPGSTDGDGVCLATVRCADETELYSGRADPPGGNAMKTYIGVYLGSAYLAVLLTPIVIWLARRIGAVDWPNVRSVHTRPIPRIGGVAIFLPAILRQARRE